MFDIFEQPWTLVGAAVLVLFGMLTFRSFCPEKRRFWQLLVPVLVVVAAFGADLFVQTDNEKIIAVIKTALRAVKDEDYKAIEPLIINNYSDSYHNSKKSLLDHCKRELSRPLVDKSIKRGLLIDISDSDATAILFLLIIFDKDSYISQNYKSFLLVKARLSFRKQPDKNWLISRIEILELDRQPTNWSRIR